MRGFWHYTESFTSPSENRFQKEEIGKDAVLLTCRFTSLLLFLRATVTQFSFKGICGKL